jgi:hypothetical protein
MFGPHGRGVNVASIRDQYSKDEWRTLQFAYLWAFRTMMGDEGVLNIQDDIGVAPMFRDQPLARTVIESLQKDMKRATKALDKDRRSATQGFGEVADILDRKATADEALGFKTAVVSMAGQTVMMLKGMLDDPQLEVRDFVNAKIAEGEAAVALIASSLRLPR